MHLLSKDLLQAVELEEVARNSISLLRRVHIDDLKEEIDERKREVMKGTVEALDYQVSRFRIYLRGRRRCLRGWIVRLDW